MLVLMIARAATLEILTKYNVATAEDATGYNVVDLECFNSLSQIHPSVLDGALQIFLVYGLEITDFNGVPNMMLNFFCSRNRRPRSSSHFTIHQSSCVTTCTKKDKLLSV